MAWSASRAPCKMALVADPSYNQLQRVLAVNVRRRRHQLGLTQEGAAQAMHVATRHLQKLEAGELNVTLRTLCRVAQALGVEVHELFAPPPSDAPDPTSPADSLA